MNPNFVKHGPAARRLIGTLLLIGLVVGVVACSDDKADDNGAPDRVLPVIDQIKDATFAAGSARYSGEQRFADGATGPVEGVSQADPPAGQATYPVRTANGLQQAEIVWVDGTLYVKRVVTEDPNAVSSVQRMADELPWISVPFQELVLAQFDAYNPFRLLERLQELGVDAVPQGTESVGGADLDRYVVDLASNPVVPGGARTMELLTNGEHRLEVMRLIADDRIEYALDDFGTDVVPSPPPDDQIGEPRPAVGEQPAGPFQVVGQGTTAGVAWKLSRGPGSVGGSCWRLETDQPLDPVAATESDGTTCISSVDPSGLDDDQVEVVADAGRGAPFDAFVAVTGPGATSANLVFTDRTSEDLVVDPAGFVVWIGPKTPLAAVLEVTTADGTVVTCGPGSITEAADLASMSPEQLEQLDRTPWLCLAL